MKIFKKIQNNKVIATIIHYLKNKYILTLVIFVVWVGVFDENNLIDRAKQKLELNEIERSQQLYRDKIKQDKAEMDQLDKNENLERLAREKYLMKRADEDIFIIE